ncbi:hypothetical protein IFM89_029961 [Coptis chinensis]|uniref:Peptidase A1 domain-containing protein n=1 Tax=Coptis chinensis TaxID=261450 RepID=A0A835HF93_9MAGN|nr:hypothetical protein IFM89_029961 [Coptis chinensis]
MYSSSLTKEERYDLMVELSKKCALRLSAELDYAIANRETTNGSTFPDVLTPKVGPAFDSVYAVELDIGTPPQPFFLELDTGGNLIWLQCAGCTECFGLNNGCNYEDFKSNTYEYLL